MKKKTESAPDKNTPRSTCFAFYVTKAGKPACHALRDVYCLKERTPCPFRKTRKAAAAAQQSAVRRLVSIGRIK